MSAWPDDSAVSARRSRIATCLARGSAVCPSCTQEHAEAGWEHLEKPWSITPLCRDCGEPLRMPEHQGRAA